MKKLTLGKEIIDIPESWNDLTAEQLLYISRVTYDQMNINVFKFNLFRNITGIQVKKHRLFIGGAYCYRISYKKKIYVIDLEELTMLMEELFRFIFKTQTRNREEHTFIDSNLVKQLLPVIKHRFRKYYGPADGLSNIVFEEYISAVCSYHRYTKTQDTKHIDMLIATLYRRGRDKKEAELAGDTRLPFNDNVVEKQSLRFKNLDAAVKTAIMYFFSGSIENLKRLFPAVFTGAGSAGNSDPFFSYMELTDALAKYDITKKTEIRKSLLFDVLSTLNNMIIQSKSKKTK